MQVARKISDLLKGSNEERAKAVGEIARATRAKPNGELRQLDEQIRTYERKYEFDSATMRERVAAGTLRESEEVCEWLMLLKLRDRIASFASRPR